MVGHGPHAGLRVVGAAREPDGDACRHAEIAQHQRHRAREVLAVAGSRLRDEADERRVGDNGRMARVREAAADAEPRFERKRGRIRAARAARHGDRGMLERRVARDLGMRVEHRVDGLQALRRPERGQSNARPDLEERVRLHERLRVQRPRAYELRRLRPRRVAPRRVLEAARQSGREERDPGLGPLQRCVARVERHRDAAADEMGVRKRLDGHLLAHPVGAVARGRRARARPRRAPDPGASGRRRRRRALLRASRATCAAP